METQVGDAKRRRWSIEMATHVNYIVAEKKVGMVGFRIGFPEAAK